MMRKDDEDGLTLAPTAKAISPIADIEAMAEPWRVAMAEPWRVGCHPEKCSGCQVQDEVAPGKGHIQDPLA